MARTTHRSSKGTKLYAVRDKDGQFEDIQTFKRAHGQDVKRDSAAERMADAMAAAKAVAKKRVAKASPAKKSPVAKKAVAKKAVAKNAPVKAAMPIVKTLRRPKMSPRRAPRSRNPPNASV